MQANLETKLDGGPFLRLVKGKPKGNTSTSGGPPPHLPSLDLEIKRGSPFGTTKNGPTLKNQKVKRSIRFWQLSNMRVLADDFPGEVVFTPMIVRGCRAQHLKTRNTISERSMTGAPQEIWHKFWRSVATASLQHLFVAEPKQDLIRKKKHDRRFRTLCTR